ncbi:MAG: hypothetical protein JWM34_484 [Ilumatobacteraceae bacterium]|nr:hypothetical protein [Ilumatobacteraceae bacterium]
MDVYDRSQAEQKVHVRKGWRSAADLDFGVLSQTVQHAHLLRLFLIALAVVRQFEL